MRPGSASHPIPFRGTADATREVSVTRSIYRRFDGKLALNCFVIEGGEVAVGDEVQLVRGRACSEPASLLE